MSGAPADPGTPSTAPPTTPPPTGSKWKGVEVTGSCGRSSIAWMLVDEMCGDVDDPHYLDSLRAPMFRDGARLGNFLYTVDATHLWVLDVENPSEPAQKEMISGLGHPLAIAAYANFLLIASGETGLTVLDPNGLTKLAELEFDGPALDVFVEGDRALVATGKGGIALVDLTPLIASVPAEPKIAFQLHTPGFAVGVAARGDYAYVAACDQFAVVDLKGESVKAESWYYAYDSDGLLSIPAKDVALAGTEAFVAAGRYGAVAVDISVPTAPVLEGNCTEQYDTSFYASGLRDNGAGKLFVAGGEWGIMSLDTSTPGHCPTRIDPTPLPSPSPDDACSSTPPWQIMPWENLWDPPPPHKDPIQVLPDQNLVYAFGDARRIGARAVEVRSDDLTPVGRYDEPRLITDLAAGGGRVLVVGPGAGLFQVDAANLLNPIGIPEKAETGTGATILPDGRWAFTSGFELHVENTTTIALSQSAPAHGLSSAGLELVIAADNGAERVDLSSQISNFTALPETAELPPTVLSTAQGIVIAAPEWDHALSISPEGSVNTLSPHGVFDAQQILDINLWREGVPRRLLADSKYGVVEIASLGRAAGLLVHSPAGPGAKLALPAGTYVDSVSAGDALYLVVADRGNYVSSLITVVLGETTASVGSIESFTGFASAIAADGERLYVGDASQGIRVYSVGATMPKLLGVVNVGGGT